MDRLTTDNPQNNLETMLNMVYGKDGWGYIRHGEGEMPVTDFCFNLCKEHGCDDIAKVFASAHHSAKDEFLSDCVFEGCPVATVYAALCGYLHTRDRLKRYEDAGVMPPEVTADETD